MIFVVVDEPNRRPYPQFATLGLIQNATLQPRTEYVQLGFAHSSLQPEQQAIIELGRIIDTVFVQNERIGEGTDLQQPMPIDGVTCQSRDF